jgi:negative regulator of flagellin synthesis FlgM
MKIDHTGLPGPQDPRATGRTEASGPLGHGANQAGQPADRVQISSQAAALQEIRNGLDRIPEVRAELVSELRALVDTGRYAVRADEVADRLLRDLLSLSGTPQK